ncbi:MAG TPA: ABC transporter permease [Solirubrobacteraceae bacterium]|nr:ABC transporter permease [Solirubrobacteraceae bacterium]
MIGLVLHQARYDLLTFVRNRQGRFFTVALPVLFLVIFVSVFGNNHVGPEHLKSSTYYVPGIAALAVLSASFANLAVSITTQRELGVLKRRRATPVPAWVLVAGRALSALVVSLVVMAVVIAIGRLAYDVHVASSALPALALTAVVGSLAFACLGYALATLVSSADAAQPVVLAITLPLNFISGVFIPSPRLSSALRHVAEVFPVQHLVAALHTSFIHDGHGSAIAWGDLALVAAWGVAGLALALARFSWSPRASAA